MTDGQRPARLRRAIREERRYRRRNGRVTVRMDASIIDPEAAMAKINPLLTPPNWAWGHSPP